MNSKLRETLNVSENRYEAMVESAQDAIIGADSLGIILSWNLAAERIFGVSKLNAIGKDLTIIMPERFKAAHRHGMERVRQTGHSKLAGGTVELVGLKADGTEIPIEMSLSCYGDNKNTHFTSIIRDISARKELERELHLAKEKAESEKNFRKSITELIPNQIYVYDLVTETHLFKNRDFFDHLGHYPEQKISKGNDDLHMVIHPDDIQTKSDGETVECLKRVKQADGSWRWILNYENVFKRDDQGKPIQVIGISQDITKLKEIESALLVAKETLEQRVSERTDDLKSLTESIPHIVWQIAPDGSNTYMSPKWEEYTGSPSDGRTWAEVIHHDDILVASGAWEESLRTGKPFEAEYRLKAKDGSYRWFLARGVAQFSSEGKIKKWFGTSTDIHEKKLAQEFQNNFFEFPDLMLCLAGYDGHFIKMNSAWENTLGFTQLELTESPWLDFVHSEDLEITIEEGKKLTLGEPVVNFHNRYRCKDGNYKWLHWTCMPKGGVIYCVASDVSYLKRAERERAESLVAAQSAVQSSLLKSQFLANMSHEIRTPINGVLGMSGLMLDTVLTSEQRSFVMAIQRSGESLLSVISDILDFSKIEAGKLIFEETPFQLSEVFTDTEQMLRFMVDAKKLQLNIDIAKDIPALVIGDCGRFKQVLVNLLSNAIKFTPRGSIEMCARVDSLLEDEVEIRIEVIDSGVGISPEIQNTLFQAFTQADASTARRYGGSGLGLSICKGLVTQMGGQIGVKSEIGKGSTFWFTSKLKIAAVDAKGIKTNPSKISGELLKGRILVAEDNALNQIITVKMLEKYGLRADVVGNGYEVLDALQSLPYDLVLMDCQMPEMDGYEATQLIRKSLTLSNPHIPILAMTANAMAGDLEKCLASGMNDYISKPVKAEKLIEVVTKYLSNPQKGQVA